MADDSGKEDGSCQVVSPFQKGALASSSFPLALFTEPRRGHKGFVASIYANDGRQDRPVFLASPFPGAAGANVFAQQSLVSTPILYWWPPGGLPSALLTYCLSKVPHDGLCDHASEEALLDGQRRVLPPTLLSGARDPQRRRLPHPR